MAATNGDYQARPTAGTVGERQHNMALRGVDPAAVQKRMKALWYGPPGSGKTLQALQFPRPYLVDTERGAENEQYVKALKKAGGLYFPQNDPDQIIAEVRSLISEKHPYKTLILDPLTVPYNDLLDKSATALATAEDPSGTAFSRHKGPADRKIKHLLNLLLRLDMNIIVTSHAKTKWERDGKGGINDIGLTFDCYGKLDYLFDLVFEVHRRGDECVAIVKKSRLDAFRLEETIVFSYDEIANRYGRALLERDAVAVELATPEQITELTALLAVRTDGTELLEKWLKKAMAESIPELPAEAAGKCIAFLKSGAATPPKETKGKKAEKNEEEANV